MMEKEDWTLISWTSDNGDREIRHRSIGQLMTETEIGVTLRWIRYRSHEQMNLGHFRRDVNAH